MMKRLESRVLTDHMPVEIYKTCQTNLERPEMVARVERGRSTVIEFWVSNIRNLVAVSCDIHDTSAHLVHATYDNQENHLYQSEYLLQNEARSCAVLYAEEGKPWDSLTVQLHGRRRSVR